MELTTKEKEPHCNELIVCLRVYWKLVIICVVEYIEKQ